MKHIYNTLLLTSLLCFFFSCDFDNHNYRKNRVARSKQYVLIQPINHTNPDFLLEIRKAIEEEYGFQTAIAKSIDVPKDIINTEKGFRYNANRLLPYLNTVKPDSCTLIMGYTATDIYTSKRNKEGNIKKPESTYKVWGIFGLGQRPGTSCLVSTKRLYTSRTSVYKARLIKVSMHEIGHNLGLSHCKDKTCLMTDAAETIKTIDKAGNHLCNKCLQKINR